MSLLRQLNIYLFSVNFRKVGFILFSPLRGLEEVKFILFTPLQGLEVKKLSFLIKFNFDSTISSVLFFI